MHRPSIVTIAALSLALGSDATAQKTTVLRAARMIDGTGAQMVHNAVIVVDGDRIVAAGPAASVTVPAGAR